MIAMSMGQKDFGDFAGSYRSCLLDLQLCLALKATGNDWLLVIVDDDIWILKGCSTTPIQSQSRA
jgi:hypothetical protein